MSNLEGIFLDPPINHRRIGPRLGSGACGVVYEVIDVSKTSQRFSLQTSSSSSSCSSSSEPVRCAVKLTPFAAPSAASIQKKKKKTPAERNADLLYHEYLLYRNVLNTLRGTVIPQVPLATQGFGDIPGYRFLIMELMKQPLFSSLPEIISSNAALVNLGLIASTLVSHIQQVHSLQYLIVDVKPENFMIAHDPPHVNRPSPIHTRIRIIDVGLFETFKDAMTRKHRDDVFPNGKIVGTPIYASLNVLQGHGISRRDDLEALGYVLLEMILLIHHTYAAIRTSTKKFPILPPNGLLPWSDGKSDGEILSMKKDIMDKFLKYGQKSALNVSSSSLMDALTTHHNEAVGMAMKNFMSLVRNLSYDEKPDYDALMKIVSSIQVRTATEPVISISSKRARASSNMKPTNRKTTTPKENLDTNVVVKDMSAMETSDMDVSVQKKSTRVLRKRVVTHSIVEEYYDDDDVVVVKEPSVTKSVKGLSHGEINDKQDEDESTTFITAQCGSDMDWECVDTKSPSILLLVVEGPHTGESISVSESCVLGHSSNKKSRDTTVFHLAKDHLISACHTKVDFSCSNHGVSSLRVTDQKHANGTFLNNRKIPSGGHRQAFIGDKIKIGATVLEVKRG